MLQILIRVEDQRVPLSRRSLVRDAPIWRLTELHRKTLSGHKEIFWGTRDKSPLSCVSRESPRSTSGPAVVPLRLSPTVSLRFSRSVSLQKVTFPDLSSILRRVSSSSARIGRALCAIWPKETSCSTLTMGAHERGSFVTFYRQLFLWKMDFSN